MQDIKTRAKQHLIVNGFTLYDPPAAVCLDRMAPQVLGTPGHAWAVILDKQASRWIEAVPAESPYKQLWTEAASKATADQYMVVCHLGMKYLTVPLTVNDVRFARDLLQKAIEDGMSPPADRLESYTDEMISQEAKRRARRQEQKDKEEARASKSTPRE